MATEKKETSQMRQRSKSKREWEKRPLIRVIMKDRFLNQRYCGLGNSA